MSWLLLIKSLIGGLANLTKWLADRQLLDAGEAKQIAENLQVENQRIEKAIQKRTEAANSPLDADADGVPDDDGYRRD